MLQTVPERIDIIALTMSLISRNSVLDSCKLISHSLDFCLNRIHQASLPFKLPVKGCTFNLLEFQLLLYFMMLRLQTAQVRCMQWYLLNSCRQ